MRKLLFIFGVCILVSCSKEIQDGPFVYFSNNQELADTISQKDSITFEITAIGNGYKVTRAQLFVNKTEFFDSSFAATDSISIKWTMDFSGRINTQNILIQATDEHDMIATQTKKIYIQ